MVDRQQADAIVQRHQKSAPVQVMAIATDLGIAVWRSSLGPDISGKLFHDRDHGGTSGYSILVNINEAYVRQRFTMAHEIGHFVLHLDAVGAEVVDDTFYRSKLSSPQEAEANKFAADLLMPFSLINELQKKLGADPNELAKALGVSSVAMKIRLGIPVPA